MEFARTGGGPQDTWRAFDLLRTNLNEPVTWAKQTEEYEITILQVITDLLELHAKFLLKWIVLSKQINSVKVGVLLKVGNNIPFK